MNLRIDVHHYHHLPARESVAGLLNRLEERIVSKLSDKIDAASESLDAAVGRVGEDVAALQAKVAELQAMADSGGASQADLDRLDALKAKLDALDPTKPAVLPEDGGGDATDV